MVVSIQKKQLIVSLIVFLFCILLSSAENFRVHKTVIVNIQNQIDSSEVQLGINDSLAIFLPEDTEFLKGLEFEITIPQVAAYNQGAIAWSLYDNISPQPNVDVIDYSGNKLYLNTFPGTLSYNVKIPFVTDHGLESSPYTTILKQLYSQKSDFVFLRFQLAMKGTSPDLYNAMFTVQVKPVLYDEGLLNLNISYPKHEINSEDTDEDLIENLDVPEKSVIYVDDEPVTELINGETKKSLRLATGTHHLSIVSDNYRNEVRTFTIEQAKISALDIVMHNIMPLVVISAPSSAKIFMDEDEVLLSDKEIPLLPGEHQIKFIIDDYELVKKIVVENGKTYSINLSMNIDVSEKSDE
ncbi:MAG: hypothetical protein BKP49_08765 [Treponema sp. CETP13]|nr:MAG: hypothetical protein BKP49_08765 [Treponema sp. CETP13]